MDKLSCETGDSPYFSMHFPTQIFRDLGICMGEHLRFQRTFNDSIFWVPLRTMPTPNRKQIHAYIYIYTIDIYIHNIYNSQFGSFFFFQLFQNHQNSPSLVRMLYLQTVFFTACDDPIKDHIFGHTSPC